MKHVLFVLFILFLALSLTAASADGGPTSQFGFKGWPYRNGTGCGASTPAPTAHPSASPVATPTAHPAPAPTVVPTARPTERPFLSSRGDYTTTSVSAQEQKMLEYLNRERIGQGLPALAMDAELSRIARVKAEDMRDHRYFAHESPTYGNAGQMLSSFGYPYAGVGENIAHHADVAKAHAAFMSSAGHRTNILGRQWKKVGIGIALDDNGFVYISELFVR